MPNHSKFHRVKPEDIAAIIFALAGLLWVLVLFKAPQLLGAKEPNVFQTELVIATTVLLAGLITFLTRLITFISRFGERRAFRRFFGAANSALGVVPDLVTKTDLAGWEPPNSNGARPKGVTKVVAFEDLQAATKIAELFDRFGVPIEIRRDYTELYDDLPRRNTLVAIGLGFNRLTCMLATRSEIFKIHYKDLYSAELKDDFTILEKQHDPPNDQYDYALVVRAPLVQDGRAITAFVCAGRMAEGTAAAGNFLKNEWRTLYDLYRRERKSLRDHALAIELQHTPGPMSRYRIVAARFRALEEPELPPLATEVPPIPAAGTTATS